VTLSRTARILIALLMVAAAAFVWINFFAETPAPAVTPGTTVETPSETPSDSAATTTTPGVAELPTVPVEPGDTTPTVVTGPEVDVVGRDVVVAELPFLVTEGPAPAAAATDTEAADGEVAAGSGGQVRASINPFSPIVVQEPAQAAGTSADTTTAPEVVDVAVPTAPSVTTVEVVPPLPPAPAPRPLAPTATRTATLPRTLPGGTLPVAPSLLTGRRAQPAEPTPIELPERTAVREPEGTGTAPALAVLGGDLAERIDEPALLAPGAVPTAGTPDRPLVTGADDLARFLRDRNVAFTGSVVGSVSVGVFRLSGSTAPIVLALGQQLPDTAIVLTDLRGQAAEFTLGDTTHVLNLDLRR